MLKLLDQDLPSVTIFHREGWLAFPEVVAVKMRFVSAVGHDPAVSDFRPDRVDIDDRVDRAVWLPVPHAVHKTVWLFW